MEARAGVGREQPAPGATFRDHAARADLLKALVTRAYFAGETFNETDPLLCSIEDPRRRATLIANPVDDNIWRLDILLQGDGETVFLDL
jgi:protocatechuate 3,4-dioxygenase, alpha subunit